jgi:Transglycosylase SLT domain
MKYFLKRLTFVIIMSIMAFFLGSLLGSIEAKCDDRTDLIDMAHRSHLYISNTALEAFIKAGHTFDVPVKELITIAILESALNEHAFRSNKNGTSDFGVMQVNSINAIRCVEYNIHTTYGNVMCSAKIISLLRESHPSDYLGRYHSATPKIKHQYIAKINKVLYSNNH